MNVLVLSTARAGFLERNGFNLGGVEGAYLAIADAKRHQPYFLSRSRTIDYAVIQGLPS